MTQSKRICVGAIIGAYGVKGQARIKSFCAEPAAIADYNPLTSEDGQQEYILAISHPIKAGFVATIDGLTQKEQVDSLKGTALYAQRDSLPGLADDEFYHADLIGLEVCDPGGQVLGRVHTVQEHGAGDILEISGSHSHETMLLPFTKEVVPTVDLSVGRIIVDPPEGLNDGEDDV